jgi:hypothetical protein
LQGGKKVVQGEDGIPSFLLLLMQLQDTIAGAISKEGGTDDKRSC